MTGKILRLVMPLLLLAGSGCAIPIKHFETNQTVIDPNLYLVAFSFDPSAAITDDEDTADWHLKNATLHWKRAPSLQIANADHQRWLVLLQSNKANFDLGDLQMFWHTGRFRNELYESTVSGPSVSLEPGAITYIGNVVLHKTKFAFKSGRPESVVVTIEDQWGDDAEQWKSKYAVINTQEPIRRIAPSWDNSGQVAMRYVNPVSIYYDPRANDLPTRPPFKPVISTSSNPRNGR